MARAFVKTRDCEEKHRVFVTNIKLAKKLIEKLQSVGVEHAVICTGGRNAPLVKLLGVTETISKNYFFEERSAAFFALGKARRTNSPVAVFTTSGTAAAELLPATVEAYYTQIPLILVTADRPESYVGTGAPQSINQINLFGEHAGATIDWSVQHSEDFSINKLMPTHINIRFDEPLLDEGLPKSLSFGVEDLEAIPKVETEKYQSDLDKFFEKAQRPLFLLSEMSGPINLENKICYAEAPSQHRNKNVLKAFDAFYSTDNFLKHFDSVVRIGGVPTHRIWRDLDHSLKDIPVLSISDRPFRGLAREHSLLPMSALSALPQKFDYSNEILSIDEKLSQKTTSCLSKYENSEPAMFRKISIMIPEKSFVFLGNSLSIREWDHFAEDFNKDFEIGVMRGVNGIDGTISHFLGRLNKDVENWLILGDLTALYDVAAFSFLKDLRDYKIRIVVINNSGGKIFKPLFNDANFEYQHSFNFKAVASMFGWGYSTALKHITDQSTIIEVKPDNDETDAFMKEYKSLRSKL